MKQNLLKYSCMALVSAGILTGCATASKPYKDLERRHLNLEREKAECDENLLKAQTERKNLDERLSQLTKDNEKLTLTV